MAIPFFRKDRNKPDADPAQNQKTEEAYTDFATLTPGSAAGLGIVVEEVGSAGESAIDEAAMLYASGQTENTETVLKSLLTGNDRRVWHMLFDL
jgi:hypothetical protein